MEILEALVAELYDDAVAYLHSQVDQRVAGYTLAEVAGVLSSRTGRKKGNGVAVRLDPPMPDHRQLRHGR